MSERTNGVATSRKDIVMTLRYDSQALTRFAEALLTAASMPQDKAADVASILVEGDLLGRRTHGLALLAPYL